ncbi:MAG: helical backbone metal receptor [Endomicrobiaceae bacterium]|jgi:iron complex transport system substrate-binding protein|nr:helical backbone metal receptor [Endomicrobiaceae bacterium]MDD3730148.1 helical backbone metal receptor [Endomicrobiaceae bacterium]MDD4165920.1 helical backbone metal receptor [Endomicrobiaceae bacterium]
MKKIFITLIIVFISANLFAEYKRIISLAPSVTRSLYELGLEEKVIAVTVYCPKGNIQKENVGTLLEPNIEKIISLNPDLIISTKEGNNKSVIEKIQRLGCKVYVMDTVSNFDEICKNFQNLGNYLDKKETADKILKTVRDEIDGIFLKTKNKKSEKIFWEVGAQPLFTAGKKSFVNNYNKFLGTTNIFEDIDMRYPNINIESVILKNPDIILLVNMGDITHEEIKRWKQINTINAVKNNRIYMLDVNDIFTPTPLTFLKGVKIILKTLYPDFENEK